MNKTLKILAGLLGAQLLLALVLGLGGRDFAAAPETALLEFDPEAVDRLVIADADGETLTLKKGDPGWLIPDLADIPAAAHKVTQRLDELAALKPRHPVSTSDAGAERFKVAEDGFERHILAEADGETLAELYLGESAGFRRSYLRRADGAAVYELEIAAFDFATDPQQWADKTLLNLDADQVQAFGMADWTLERTEDGWALRDDEREVDAAKADELLGDLSRLSYIAVESAKENQAAEALAVARLQLKAGEAVQLSLYPAEAEGRYALISSQHPWRFVLGRTQGEKIEEAELDGLLVNPPEPPAEDTEASPEPSEEAASDAEAAGAEPPAQ